MIKTMTARYAGRDAMTGAATLMLALAMLASILAGALHYFDVLIA